MLTLELPLRGSQLATACPELIEGWQSSGMLWGRSPLPKFRDRDDGKPIGQLDQVGDHLAELALSTPALSPPAAGLNCENLRSGLMEKQK